MLQNLFMHIHYCNGGKRMGLDRTSRPLMRTLSHHELMYICSGRGSFTICGRSYAVEKGMLLYICPNEPYTVRMEPDRPAGCLTVHFSCADVRFDEGAWSIRGAAPLLTRHFAWKLRNPSLIEGQFRNLVDRWNEKLPGYELVTRTLFQQMVIDVARDFRRQSPGRAAPAKVEDAVQYMRRHVEGKLTLPALAEAVRLSPAHLSRTFREATGYTVIEYFNKLKIDRSKEFLAEGWKIREIAQKLGFADEFYFSRLFKKLEGVSPSEFYSRIVHAD